MPSAPSSGKVVNLTAKHIQWSVKTISAPAGETWKLHFDNQDKIEAGFHVKHNFVIATGKSFAERSFSSPTVEFGTYTFDVPGLPAGTYSFMRTVHPDAMNGSLTLE
jgi:plastocyanin